MWLITASAITSTPAALQRWIISASLASVPLRLVKLVKLTGW